MCVVAYKVRGSFSSLRKAIRNFTKKQEIKFVHVIFLDVFTCVYRASSGILLSFFFFCQSPVDSISVSFLHPPVNAQIIKRYL